jgi:hypothetical protein
VTQESLLTRRSGKSDSVGAAIAACERKVQNEGGYFVQVDNIKIL